jgi:hypothetical protein
MITIEMISSGASETMSKVTLVSTGHRTLRGNGMPFPSTPTHERNLLPSDAMEARYGFVV